MAPRAVLGCASRGLLVRVVMRGTGILGVNTSITTWLEGGGPLGEGDHAAIEAYFLRQKQSYYEPTALPLPPVRKVILRPTMMKAEPAVSEPNVGEGRSAIVEPAAAVATSASAGDDCCGTADDDDSSVVRCGDSSSADLASASQRSLGSCGTEAEKASPQPDAPQAAACRYPLTSIVPPWLMARICVRDVDPVLPSDAPWTVVELFKLAAKERSHVLQAYVVPAVRLDGGFDDETATAAAVGPAASASSAEIGQQQQQLVGQQAVRPRRSMLTETLAAAASATKKANDEAAERASKQAS